MPEPRTPRDRMIWLAVAVAAPAFILAPFFFGRTVLLQTIAHYREVGPLVFWSDLSMFTMAMAVMGLQRRIGTHWLRWGACVVLSAALAAALWIPAHPESHVLHGPGASLLLAGLLASNPIVHRHREKRTVPASSRG